MMTQSVQELIVEKHAIIKFGMRVREIDKNYELNNNFNLDNGVFNKFAQAAEKKALEQHQNGGSQMRQSRQLFNTQNSSMLQ